MRINLEKEAVLTSKYLKSVLEYNHESGEFTWIKARQGIRVGQTAGGLSKTDGYVTIWINCRPYKAHRLAWLYVHGYFPREERNQLDHIDGNRSNNRIENLRESSYAENNKNQGMKSNNTSGVNGVHLSERTNSSGKTYR